MDRRMFLRTALIAAGSATAFAVVGTRESKAESLMDQLKAPHPDVEPNAADMPAEGAQEAQYWGGNNRWGGHPGWRRRRHWNRGYGYGWRRRRWARRCWWRVNRWGRAVRVCAW